MMEIELGYGELCLVDNSPIKLTGAAGLRVSCIGGVVWITSTGNREDIILESGQQYRIDSNRLTMIESIGGGRIRLHPRSIRNWLGNLLPYNKDRKSVV
jgi:hypothetical protein